MKKMIFVALIVVANSLSFAGDDIGEIKEALNEISKPEVRAKLPKFIMANINASQKEAKRMKLLDRVNEIVFYDLSNKYKATPHNYEQLIHNKEDRELYKIVLTNNKKRSIRKFLLCSENEPEAMKKENLSWDLRQKKKGLMPNSDETISIDEQILKECKYDDSVIWELLATYRFKKNREKYNSLMLRIIKEDQVEYDYSGSPSNELSDSFVDEFKSFLGDVNSLHKSSILSKEDVSVVGEAALTKYPDAFSLRGLSSVEDAYYVVQPIVVLVAWLDYYKLEDIKRRFVNTFLSSELAKRTLMVYSANMKGFKETLDYIQQM